MAKISPTSIKYSIIASFVADGPFQKPDVIGALFGQTEGLLGSDMELRELQKEGKIGRIEVDLKTEGGKTTGEIIIPSALDKTETTIIAASLETIDKIGPTDAKISIKEISDVRGSKRDYIMERAKALLSGIKNEGMDSSEMGTELRDSARAAKVVIYGEEGLAAGPDVETSKEIIVVEGRADVVNMLKAGINNVIGMQGTKFPKTITKLSETKEITLFVDGDRGGNLIAQNVCDNAKIAFITQAPDGKEVEELAGKEIHMCLRRKVPAQEFFKKPFERKESYDRRDSYERRDSYDRRDRSFQRNEEPTAQVERRAITSEDISKLRNLLDELKGRNVLVINDSLEVVKNIPASRLSSVNPSEAFILMTTNATSSLIESAEKLKSRAIAAKTFGKVQETSVELISL